MELSVLSMTNNVMENALEEMSNVEKQNAPVPLVHMAQLTTRNKIVQSMVKNYVSLQMHLVEINVHLVSNCVGKIFVSRPDTKDTTLSVMENVSTLTDLAMESVREKDI